MWKPSPNGPVALKLSLHHAGLSDVGQHREVNEDSFCAIPQLGLFVVADGMGGHKAGDVASRMATEAIGQFFTDTEGEDSTWPFHFDPQRSYEENRLLAGVKLANRRIYEASLDSLEVQGMGTTVVSCVFASSGDRVYIGHVGDSRCYRYRREMLELMTRDHSLVNDYRQAMPHLTEEQMASLPRNVITRALGMQESVVVDILIESPEPGDVYLLCSDGLSESVSQEQIQRTLTASRGDLDVASRDLVALANASGGDDNITVLLVTVEGAPRGVARDDLVSTRRISTLPASGAGGAEPREAPSSDPED
jgi:protein phosphatase